MNSLHKLLVVAGVALACTLALPSAEAHSRKPGWYAYGQLQYGSGWELYDAGCLKWNYRNQSWYTRCGLPQNAVLHRPALSVRY
jgi:hypothetical protein